MSANRSLSIGEDPIAIRVEARPDTTDGQTEYSKGSGARRMVADESSKELPSRLTETSSSPYDASCPKYGHNISEGDIHVADTGNASPNRHMVVPSASNSKPIPCTMTSDIVIAGTTLGDTLVTEGTLANENGAPGN